jgi:L-aspartate oxidase
MAISERMATAPGGIDDHVFLDASHLGERFYTRFPGITEACRAIGVDPARQRIPVAPAAHYACGGVPARLDGTTALAGLYAVGEVSCTGVHGANRLASNSLTEGVVAGTRLGRELAWELPDRIVSVEPVDDRHGLVDPAARVRVRAAMSRHVGVTRSASSLTAAAGVLDDAIAASVCSSVAASQAAFEATNLATVARATTAAASARSESRGCHRRRDHPERREVWRLHLRVRLGDDATVQVARGPERP